MSLSRHPSEKERAHPSRKDPFCKPNHREPDVYRIADRIGQRMMNRIKTAFLTALCLLTASCGGGSTDATVKGQAPKIVLLVHGYQSAPEDMNYYRERLSEHLPRDRWRIEIVTGLDSSYNILSKGGPDDNTRRTEVFLREKTGQTLDQMSDKSIFLIGHSMGGLICRQFSVWHPEKTARIFLVGTPNGGMRSLPPTSWASSEQMNEQPGSSCWNCTNKAQEDVEYHLFVGTCSGPPATPLEGVPNDGLVSQWSVEKLMDYRESESVSLSFEYYRDGHATGLPATGGCETVQLEDGRITDRIANILLSEE